jgi:transcriptional regulator with XRE-family HTH domain
MAATDPPIRWQLARSLDAAMVEDGWTRTDMARRAGFTRKHIYNLLNGESGRLETYDQLAHILDRRWVVFITVPVDRRRKEQR